MVTRSVAPPPSRPQRPPGPSGRPAGVAPGTYTSEAGHTIHVFVDRAAAIWIPAARAWHWIDGGALRGARPVRPGRPVKAKARKVKP